MLLSSIPSPPENVWYLGPIPIRAYAIAIIIGIIVAYFIADRRYVKKGGPEEVSLDVAVWMVLFGIVGARLYHVVTTPEPYFGPDGDPWRILRIWEGGLGIWGAIALGAVGGFIALHRRNLRFAPFADAVAPGILIAQAIGRFGNWFNQELYGRPTDLPWGLEIDAQHLPAGYAEGTLFHPTFLYEALWCVAAFFVLLFLEKRFNLRGGQTAVMYIMLYTLGRVWIENLRIDEAQIILGLRLNVWTSIFVFLAALLVFIGLSFYLKKHPELDDIYLDPSKVEAAPLAGDASDGTQPTGVVPSDVGPTDTGEDTAPAANTAGQPESRSNQ